jgi:hypothetical protein
MASECRDPLIMLKPSKRQTLSVIPRNVAEPHNLSGYSSNCRCLSVERPKHDYSKEGKKEGTRYRNYGSRSRTTAASAFNTNEAHRKRHATTQLPVMRYGCRYG